MVGAEGGIGGVVHLPWRRNPRRRWVQGGRRKKERQSRCSADTCAVRNPAVLRRNGLMGRAVRMGYASRRNIFRMRLV
jgi:hypothetical protein